VAKADAYLHAKFHLDPSNRLATIHQRQRQDRQDRQRSDSTGRTVLQTVAQKPTVPNVQRSCSLNLSSGHTKTYTHATDCPTWTTKVISKDDLRIVVHYRSLLYAIHCYLFIRNVNLYECVLFMSQKLLTGQQICPQNDRINAK